MVAVQEVGDVLSNRILRTWQIVPLDYHYSLVVGSLSPTKNASRTSGNNRCLRSSYPDVRDCL